jgi:hypothetical protein
VGAQRRLRLEYEVAQRAGVQGEDLVSRPIVAHWVQGRFLASANGAV